MKILVAAKHAPHGSRPIGGVQTWCRTVTRELERRGHTVESWGPEQPMPVGKFALGIIANVADTGRILDQCGQRVIICHGIIPAERPSGATVVYTSEEVRDYWGGTGPVLRQPIDLMFWSPSSLKRTLLTRFSYRRGLRFVPEIAKDMGLQYCHIRNEPSGRVREILQQSVCALATGRAALEAMACGTPVVICDHRSAYQGPLIDLNLTNSRTHNYSGRGGFAPTPHSVRQAIQYAIKRGSMREYVERHHNVVNIVDQLLEVV